MGAGPSRLLSHTQNDSDIGEHVLHRIKKRFSAGILGAHTGSGAYDIAIHNHSFPTSEDTLND
jgi:hypothetical protein